MKVICPSCEIELELPEELALGQHILCSNCGHKSAMVESGVLEKITDEKRNIDNSIIQAMENANFNVENERLNPFKKRMKGNVWIHALSLMGLFGAAILGKEIVNSLYVSESKEAEAIMKETEVIKRQIAIQRTIFKDCRLDLVLKEEGGRLPYLMAEKEPERVWSLLTTYIEKMDEQLAWIASYRGESGFGVEKKQRYILWTDRRQAWLEKLSEMHSADIEYVMSLRECFGVNYGLKKTTSGEVKQKIAKTISPASMDVDKQLAKIDAAQIRAKKIEDEYNEFVMKLAGEINSIVEER